MKSYDYCKAKSTFKEFLRNPTSENKAIFREAFKKRINDRLNNTTFISSGPVLQERWNDGDYGELKNAFQKVADEEAGV